MSLIGQAIGEVIGRGLAPSLERDGFIRRGRVWWRPDDRAIPMVIVSVEKDVRTNIGRLTFDVALHHQAIARVLDAAPLEDGPRPKDATVSANIAEAGPMVVEAANMTTPPRTFGELDDKGSPRGSPRWWWQPTPGESVESIDPIAASIKEAWQRMGVPWLNRYRDLSEAMRLLTHKRQWWIAAAAALALADHQRARQFTKQALAEAHPIRRKAIELWAAEHRIEIVGG